MFKRRKPRKGNHKVHLHGKDENHALCGVHRPRRMGFPSLLATGAPVCKKCLAIEREQKG